MDFHTLARRELQALCKKNKIPANITNAAMADALKALQIVEGIEEIVQSSQAESAQSSIESLDSSMDVTSPYVPPTAGRSTRRRNVVKEEVEAVTSMARTRRTTRKTAAKASDESQVDTMETPALVAHTSRRKGQMASACLKMDSQLKECVEEEEKKDVSMTPAPLGVTSRRRGVGEGTVQKVYSTRRSVRLAEKNVQMLNDEKSEGPELFDNELLSKDSEDQEVNVKEGLPELSEITDMEESSENIVTSEVVSAEEQDISIVELGEDACINFAVEAQPEKEISDDNMEYSIGEDAVKSENVSDEVEQSEGCVDVFTSEIEITVDVEIDVAGDSVEAKVDEICFCDEVEQEVDDDKEIGPEELNVTLVKLTELKLQQEDAQVDNIAESDSDSCDQLAIPEADEMETGGVEESEKAGNDSVGISDVPVEIGIEQIPNKYCAMTDTKLVIMKDRVKAGNLNELSLRKLTKMFKEKLEITKREALPRPALQPLPENQLIDGGEK